MEYLKVGLKKEVPNETVRVLINGEKNGIIGDVLEVEDGAMEVSVELPGAETKEVEIDSGTTTVEEPKEVKIDVA